MALPNEIIRRTDETKFSFVNSYCNVAEILFFENRNDTNACTGTVIGNYTEGQEERIFTYENDQQVWW